MFLIQALEFLIKSLDERIVDHLKELGIQVGANAEKGLADVLKMQSAQAMTPDFNPVFSAFEKISLDEQNLEQTTLKFNITWQQLMQQNKALFTLSLQNALKGESTTFNKLLVLNRFKRQLKELAVSAYQELQRREGALQELKPHGPSEGEVVVVADKKGKNQQPAQEEKVAENNIAADQSVDGWICKSISVSAKEAQDLLKVVLDNSKISVQVPYFGNKVEFNKDGIGRAEMAVMACELTILNFHKICLDIDAARKIKINDAGVMVDLLPGLWKQDKIITALNGLLQKELVARLFVEAEFNAYQQCGLSEPSRLKYFPYDTAEQARKIIGEKARNLFERVSGKKEEDIRVWSGLFEEVHDLDIQLMPYQNTTPLLYARNKPINPPPTICEGLHQMIELKGRSVALEAVEQHREGCKKLHTL